MTQRAGGRPRAAGPGEFLSGNLPAISSAAVTITAVLGMTAAVGYPGFQDYGEWLYQARLLADLLAGGSSDLARIAPYPVPLALPQLLLAGFVAVGGVIGGGAAFLVAYGLAGAWAIQALIRRYRLAAAPATLLLTGSVVLGSGFWNGFIGTQWGLIVVMAYLALSRRAATGWPALLGFGVVSFFTHGLAFAAWGLTALCFAVAERRGARFVLAVAPSVALAGWYLAASREAARGGWQSDGLAQWVFYKGYTVSKLGSFRHLVVRSATDHDVASAVYWSGVAANVAFGVALTAALVWLAVRWGRALWASDPALVAALVGMVVVVALTPSFLAGIVNPGERVLSTAMVLAVILLTGPGSPRRAVLPAVVFLAVGMLLTGISLGLIPAKASLGGPVSAAPETGAARSTSLFAHRVDQFEDAIRAADEGDMTRPLAWSTSILIPT